MEKFVINKEKWTQNDIRLLVVLLLTVAYPIIASAFFTLFVFIIMPLHRLVQGPHIYWLVASLLWVLLCAVILPCFRDTEAPKQSMEFLDDPSYPTKPHALQPFLKVEASHEKRLSLLTIKSRDSSLSMEKGVCEEKADKESLEKSNENLRKSSASIIERDKITQSGEFLNECIDTLGSDKLQEEKAECQVHAEEGKQVETQGENMEKEDEYGEDEQIDSKDVEEVAKKEKDSSSSSSSSDEDENKGSKEKDDDYKTPEKLEKGTVHESIIPEEHEEEIGEVDEEGAPIKRKKARPTIDTSRASGYYECTMPTPRSASISESNMVFLYVNPDAGVAQTENDVIVNDQGEKLEQITEKTEM